MGEKTLDPHPTGRPGKFTLQFWWLFQNSLDRGQSRKIRSSKFLGPRMKENLVNSNFAVFPEKINKMLPKPRFSKLIFGHSAGSTKWTGPIANSSDLFSGLITNPPFLDMEVLQVVPKEGGEHLNPCRLKMIISSAWCCVEILSTLIVKSNPADF